MFVSYGGDKMTATSVNPHFGHPVTLVTLVTLVYYATSLGVTSNALVDDLCEIFPSAASAIKHNKYETGLFH